MEHIKLLATLLPISLTAGINLYATIAVVGLSAKFDWVEGMPKSLDAFDNWAVISFAIAMFVVEFVVDKFEFFDNAWDTISTFIRPAGAAMIGMAALGKVDPQIAIIGAMCCGAVALQTHIAKAGTRLAVNVASPGETISNSAISLAEDGFVVAFVFLALNHPYLTSIIAAAIIVLLAIYTPKFLRWMWFAIKAVFAWFRSWFGSESEFDAVPAEEMAILDHASADGAIQCRSAGGIPGAKGKGGYLVLADSDVVFIYKKYFRMTMWRVPAEQIPKAYLVKKFLVDIVEIPYTAKEGKEKIARFAATKTKSNATARLVEKINESAGKRGRD